jgi:hypothetical protein
MLQPVTDRPSLRSICGHSSMLVGGLQAALNADMRLRATTSA